jgi:hypothetical protein
MQSRIESGWIVQDQIIRVTTYMSLKYTNTISEEQVTCCCHRITPETGSGESITNPIQHEFFLYIPLENLHI